MIAIPSNIRNFDNVAGGMMNYTFLDDCIPGLKNRVCDADGLSELKNQFFVFENKDKLCKSTESIPLGQRIMFQAMLNTGYFTILILFTKLDENRYPTDGNYLLLLPTGEFYYGPNIGITTTREIFAWWYGKVNARTDIKKVSITHPGLMVGDVSI